MNLNRFSSSFIFQPLFRVVVRVRTSHFIHCVWYFSSAHSLLVALFISARTFSSGHAPLLYFITFLTLHLNSGHSEVT
jgi:hypothetical protein